MFISTHEATQPSSRCVLFVKFSHFYLIWQRHGQHLEVEFEDTKGEIRIHKPKKDRQRNGQKKKDKQQSTKTLHRTKDRATWTLLKTRGELWCSGRVSRNTSGNCRVTLVTNLVISHELGKDREVLMWQVEHICGHLWHRYSVTVIQVIMATAKPLKWRLQLNQ